MALGLFLAVRPQTAHRGPTTAMEDPKLEFKNEIFSFKVTILYFVVNLIQIYQVSKRGKNSILGRKCAFNSQPASSFN